MQRVTIPTLFALILLVASGLAWDMVRASPSIQTTATVRATGTTATRTRTTTTTRTAVTTTTPTTESTEESTPDSTTTPSPEGTAEGTPDATTSPSAEGTPSATPEAGDEEEATVSPTVTSTEVITGSVLPLPITDTQQVTETRTLTVVGVGEVTEVPDIASITLGVETVGDDLE
ncbi:MAG: hypothetical protein ACRDIB_03535, partial [Ardenticatenaceae bacterium]